MRIKDLGAFLQVCRHSGIRRAADALYITPQGLSKQIQILEKQLGVPLFRRSSGGLVLTQYGVIFKKYAETVTERTRRMEAAIHKAWYESNHQVEFACSLGILGDFFLEHLEDLRKHNPGLDIQVWEGSDDAVHRRVLEEDTVIGIAPLPPSPFDFEAVPLDRFPYRLLVHGAHPLSLRQEVFASDLKGQRMIAFGPGSTVDLHVRYQCEQLGFTPDIAFTVSEALMACKLVRLGRGVAVLPEYLASDLPGEGIRSLPFHPDFGQHSICLLTKSGALLPESVRLLRESLLRKRGHTLPLVASST